MTRCDFTRSGVCEPTFTIFAALAHLVFFLDANGSEASISHCDHVFAHTILTVRIFRMQLPQTFGNAANEVKPINPRHTHNDLRSIVPRISRERF